MQIKVFRRPLREAQELESDINEWLKANSRSVTIQRDSHVYYNHATEEDDLVMMVMVMLMLSGKYLYLWRDGQRFSPFSRGSFLENIVDFVSKSDRYNNQVCV